MNLNNCVMNRAAADPHAPSCNADGADNLPRPALTVGIVLLDQFTLAAFAGFVDVLRLAGDYGGRSRQIHTAWQVMSWDGGPRCCSAGFAVNVTQGLPDNPEQFDYIAVCGGNDYAQGRIPGPLRDWLQLAARQRVRLLGICTGTFALAQADLIGPRTVCVHWNVLEAFRTQFAQTRAVVDRLFVDEGDLISCAGSTAAIDLALYLVARHCGRDKAQQAMRHMMLQGARPGRVPQAHFRTDLSDIQDLRVRQAAHFIEQRIDNPPSLDVIARYVGIGRRQLERAFCLATGMSPMAFQRQLRLEYGCWLLLGNSCRITQIALDCGFSDGAHFSREFRAHFGQSPRQYQKAHGGQAASQKAGDRILPA